MNHLWKPQESDMRANYIVNLAPASPSSLIHHSNKTRITVSATLGAHVYETGSPWRTMFLTSLTGSHWFVTFTQALTDCQDQW